MLPYDHSDFEGGESIGDILKNINDYKYLYPYMIDKDEAFGRFYSEPRPTGRYRPKRRMYLFIACS